MEYIVSQGRFSIPFKITGDRGPLIVCVNAVMETMFAWDTLAEFFTANGTRLLSFDFPQTRHAQILSGAKSVSISEKVEIIRDLVEHTIKNNGVKKVHIISSSWGALIAASFAEKYPEHVEKMLLGSFGVSVNPALHDITRKTMEAVMAGDPGKVASVLEQSFARHLPKRFIRGMRISLMHRSDQEWEVFLRHMEEFLSIKHATSIIDFNQIQAVTLWVNGLDDEIVNINEVTNVTIGMKNAEYILLQNIGHFLHHQEPKLMEIFLRFFQGREYHAISGVRYIHGKCISVNHVQLNP